MPVPDEASAEVERYCDERVPPDARAEIRAEHTVRGNAITIVERRPPWSELAGPEWSATKVAQLRYGGALWTLYCADSKGRWWPYEEVAPVREVGPLPAAMEEDATGIFWG